MSKPTTVVSIGDATIQAPSDLFYLQSTLLQPCVSQRYLLLAGQILQKIHLESIYEERAVEGVCGWPLCSDELENKKKKGKTRVSGLRQVIYETHDEKYFCSDECFREAHKFLSKLDSGNSQTGATKKKSKSTRDLHLQIQNVFGTSRPDPADYFDINPNHANMKGRDDSDAHAGPKRKHSTDLDATTSRINQLSLKADQV